MSSSPEVIYVFRHAQSTANVAGAESHSNAYRDAPLTEEGRRQAAKWQEAVRARRIEQASIEKLRSADYIWDPLNEDHLSESELATRSSYALSILAARLLKRPERVLAVVAHWGTINNVFNRDLQNAEAIKLTLVPGEGWISDAVPFPVSPGGEAPLPPLPLPRHRSRELRLPEAAPRLLCLAGRRTSEAVRNVARKMGLEFVSASTVLEATSLLTTSGPWAVVVAALGTNGQTRLLDLGADESSLIRQAQGCPGPPTFVVFSHTAAANTQLQCSLDDAGADKVVCSEEDFLEFLRLRDLPPPPETDVEVIRQRTLATPSPRGPSEYSHSGEPAEYAPILRRRRRDFELSMRYGTSSPAYLNSETQTRRLLQMVTAVGTPLTCNPEPGRLRIVHVSDTHGLHEWLHLPPGDVLIHTGDTVNRYKGKPENRFKEFCAWLVKVSQLYRIVIFIAGNHDTQLAAANPEMDTVLQQLRLAAPNVVYLCNSGSSLADDTRPPCTHHGVSKES
eukprot:gene1831-biopygen1708